MKKLLIKFSIKKLLLVLSIVCLFFLAFWLGKDLFIKEYKAIDFSNLTIKEAQEWAKKEGLKSQYLVINYENSESVIKDKLIKQSPLAGEKIVDKLVLVYSMGIDKDKKIMLPTISKTTKRAEIEKWFKDNFFTDVKYEYVLNEEIEKDIVLKITPNGLLARSQKIVVAVASGSENAKITVPDFTTYSYEQIIAWAKQNSINVDFNKINSKKDSGKVLSQSISAGVEIKPGSSIEITISAGKLVVVKDFYNADKDSLDSWAKENDIKFDFIEIYHNEVAKNKIVYTNPKANSTIEKGTTLKVYLSIGPKPKEKTVHVDGNHLNDSENDFVNYIKGLGLRVNKQNETYYSTTIKKGHIYSYDDGEFPLKSTINYSLSRGAYVVDLANFENKNISNVNNYVNEINSLNGHLILNVDKVNSSKEKDLLFDCHSSKDGINDVVSCKLSLGDKPRTYNLPNYIGQVNPCGINNSCTIADGHINLNIRYAYSSEAENIVISQSVSAGEVADGTVVELVISRGQKTARINSIEDFESCNSSDPKTTENNVRSILKDFTNVTFQYKKSRSYTVGYIINVYVGGNSGYEAGNYPLDTPIVIEICNGVEQ